MVCIDSPTAASCGAPGRLRRRVRVGARRALRMVLAAAGLLPALGVYGPVVLFRTFGIRRARRSAASTGLRLLRLIEGGDLESIYRKYGRLDPYFDHLIPGVTELVIGSNPGAANDFLLRLRNDYILVETRASRWFPAWSGLRTIARHLELIGRYRITIIHANSPYRIGLIGLVLARLSGVPLCVSIHSDYEKSEALRRGDGIPRIAGSLALTRWVERQVYRLADRILPISATLVPYLASQGCDETRLRIFPHGVDPRPLLEPPRLDIRRLFALPANCRLVSSAARLEAENLSEQLVEIAVRLARREPAVACLLCGGGQLLEPLRERVRREGLAGRIVLPGAVAHATVLEVRKQSDVNVCLMDGFSLIEAAGSGRPIVAYDVAWHRELVVHEETGCLVPEGAAELAVEQIVRLLHAPEEADRLGASCRQKMLQQFSRETTNQTKAAIYRELLAA